MYEYLKGIITAITPGYLVLDVSGIGYKLYCPTPYTYDVNQEAKLFVEQIIRDTEHSLYGFASAEDKALFLKLLSVSGIGPKSALAIMAAENTTSLANAIENGETAYLTKFPGVGRKTASQIVLDLKGKLGDYAVGQQSIFDQAAVSPDLNDALLALVALGYTQKEVDKITPKLLENNFDHAEDYIKLGLNLLLKKVTK
ncbi:Holliday junction DNA helicase RuvA [Amylolactobacillus amylotrophicus DSM 20534]|uniref:Holliday junction branch migration complex subunit RuvA n=3 Tax=Amylolactobacillus TaxID=2767876 RepID=A0A0R1YS76_9LACO|nr:MULTISPECIES: Holliday junction branch migration protein RuvA [Amylolactobacillus]APT18073.1 Holliday junction DNA helicase RuvA [Amylolactobacillus amylophilus DSM 20533 = JCM 1125]KRK37419.1 Holliday junction DNA helicase RuvA [Amylolactobacillus amylotrophicus DSM 20534]KRM42092.1 Holliday junction DNA helicase RuvA [Amylolactobacillus amylophilus DSM 20533 = JCM 1125]GED80567.1 Holliday junction ATP-dependent DNA helicase RuvA [Amylolactobacillus amylophilus]